MRLSEDFRERSQLSQMILLKPNHTAALHCLSLVSQGWIEQQGRLSQSSHTAGSEGGALDPA